MLRPLLLALALAPLAACGGKGTSFTLNASDGDGNMVASIGENGQMSIDAPGLTGSIKLPRITMGADAFDMNGVHLYPGSTISGMNIDAQGKDDGKVRVSFESPAAPGVVRDWFVQKLAAARFQVAPSGSGLSGKTDEGKPFRLDLAAEGGDKARGTILIG